MWLAAIVCVNVAAAEVVGSAIAHPVQVDSCQIRKQHKSNEETVLGDACMILVLVGATCSFFGCLDCAVQPMFPQ